MTVLTLKVEAAKSGGETARKKIPEIRAVKANNLADDMEMAGIGIPLNGKKNRGYKLYIRIS